MPQRHLYKCLNPNCESMTRKTRAMTFTAMNDHLVECPTCGCRKLEDWGQDIAPGIIGAEARTVIQNSDANLRRIAERYDLGDISNKGGKAAKGQAAPSPQRNEPTVKVGGIDVPVSAAAGSGCINIPGMAQKIPQASAPRTPPKSNLMKEMTNVVASHKAGA